jgi:hypothetical protein
MFGTIRRHQTWLWAIIITLTIISFVIFFSPYSRVNTERRQVGYGSINGEKISQEQFEDAWKEVQLRYFFMSGGRWPDDEAKKTGFDPEREVYQWLLLVQKQEELNIRASVDALHHVALELLRPFGRQGITSPEIFIQQVLPRARLGVADFERFLRHYVGIQELISAYGLAGKLVTPREARAIYEREHQELATEAVFFSSSNYLAKVEASPAALGFYYSNRLAEYRIPDRVQVAYVKFNLTNYLAAAEAELVKTNLAEIIEANYQKFGTNLYRDAKSPEEIKRRIREDLVRAGALAEAKKKGREFAGQLYELKPAVAENLEKLARSNGLTAAVTAPFDREEGPKDVPVGVDFVRAAFALSTNEPFAGPYQGEDGYYEIAFSKKIPSSVPTFDEIRDRVLADYRLEQARAKARQAASDFAQSTTNGLAQGKTFAALSAEAGLKAESLPPFSISTRSLPGVEERIGLGELKQAAFGAPPGKAVFQATHDGGIVLFVKSKLPLDEAKLNADLPAFTSFLRQRRTEEAFNEWFRAQAATGLRDTPLARPPAQPSTPAPGPRASR